MPLNYLRKLWITLIEFWGTFGGGKMRTHPMNIDFHINGKCGLWNLSETQIVMKFFFETGVLTLCAFHLVYVLWHFCMFCNYLLLVMDSALCIYERGYVANGIKQEVFNAVMLLYQMIIIIMNPLVMSILWFQWWDILSYPSHDDTGW